MRTFGVLVVCLSLFFGCAESSEKKPSKSNQPTPGNPGVDSGDLCGALTRHQIAANANYQDFINEFCGSLLVTLRSPAVQYRGSGTPNIQPTAVQKGAQSQMRLIASMATPADALSYFNFMRLQVSRPDDFNNLGFEYDNAIKYEVLANNGNSVSYHYTNRKEELVVEYNATSDFIEIVQGKLYVVTSRLDKSIGTVKTFRGLQVIYQMNDGTSSYTEVFSMSDQLYDNNDDHDTTVAKAKNEFSQDMARGYRNSLNASKANQFFQ